MEKKYIKKKVIKFDDGSSNDEHIKDILSQMDMLYSNIQENNDISLQIFKLKERADEDIADALQISCQNALEIEKQAGIIMQAVEKYKEKLDKNSESQLKEFLKQMKEFEKKSRKIMESVLI